VDSENLFKIYVEHFYDKKLNAKDQIEREIAKLSLNSLYGKFGQKEIESRIKVKVLDSSEATKLVTKYHYSYLSEIGNGLVLMKYSARLNEKIRRLYKEEEEELDQNFISKKRGIISAVQISSRISALARVSINKYKNMAGNELYYSDTDSLVLKKKLPTKIIGPELGKWKLEAEIIKGIFVRPKLYIYEDLKGKVKKVAAGVNANDLNYQNYIDLINGKEVTTQKSKLIVNWKKLEIKTIDQSITLRKEL
jgi:DNA polymerase type B, organellar and viral